MKATVSILYLSFSVSLLAQKCVRLISPTSGKGTGLGHRLMDITVSLFMADFLNGTYLPSMDHLGHATFHENGQGYLPFFISNGLQSYLESESILYMKENVTTLLLRNVEKSSILNTQCGYKLIFNISDCWNLQLVEKPKHTGSCFISSTFPLMSNAISTYRYWFQLQYLLHSSSMPTNSFLHNCNNNLSRYDQAKSCFLGFSYLPTPFQQYCVHLCNNSSIYKIAIHLRVGDFVMHSSSDYYISLIKSIFEPLHNHFSPPDFEIYILADDVNQSNIKSHVSEIPPPSHFFLSYISFFEKAKYIFSDTIGTIGDMMSSDLFIASGSSFAMIPYMYGHKNVVNAFPKEGKFALQWKKLCTDRSICCLNELGRLVCSDDARNEFFDNLKESISAKIKR